MKMFRLLGASERQGFGGSLIYKTAKQNDFRRPEIVTNIEMTELKVWNIDLVDSYPELTIEEKNILRLIVKSPEPLSLNNIRNMLSYTKYKVRQILPELMEMQLIEKIGSGSSTRYTVMQESIEKITQLQIRMEQIKAELQ